MSRFNPETFLRSLREGRRYRGQIVHVREIPERPARFAEPARPLPDKLAAALKARGIERLYSHQAAAVDALRAGGNVAVVTGTASGKTLCYFLPALEHILEDKQARTLCLYPTKALAQDQFRGLMQLARAADMADTVGGVYDGDTPAELRRRLRDRAKLLLTNPDMLHQGILPNHARWHRLFARLKLVVVDELHVYRGTFGSQTADVFRRLRRICAHYGSRPQFVCCSATIANAKELAEQLTGVPMTCLDDDGAPKGAKQFAVWNPPLLVDDGKGARGLGAGAAARPSESRNPQSAMETPAAAVDRKSAVSEAVNLLLELIDRNVQTICFARTRNTVEIIGRAVRDHLERKGRPAARMAAAYRGGYLPEERRSIERRLASGELLAVVSTNALELGIDIGGLDAALLVGYPGSIAALRQQAGRAGRSRLPALAVFIAGNTPIDQYLANNPDWLFGKSPESAVIDPDNPHIVVNQLRAALAELPLAPTEIDSFGPFTGACLQLLLDEKHAALCSAGWRPTRADYPAARINLRSSNIDVWTIARRAGGEVIGTVDNESAYFFVHPHAVYLHQGEPYFVLELDLEKRIAWVEHKPLGYYTQAVSRSTIHIKQVERSEPWRDGTACAGDVDVTTTIPFFKKIRFGSRESIGFEALILPEQKLETAGFWLLPPPEVFSRCAEHGLVAEEGLVGIANALVEVLPLFAMCDPSDVGSAVDAAETGQPALFVYDRVEGGMGYADKVFERLEEILKVVWDVVRKCPCEEGCPSCVGAPVPPFAMNDLDSAVRGTVPHKETALVCLHALLGLEPYVPVRQGRPRPALPVVFESPASAEAESAAAAALAGCPRMPAALEDRVRRRVKKLERDG